MKHSILIIVNSEADLAEVQQLSTRHDIKAVIGVEAGIEQLYQIVFDGILYDPGTDQRQERKLRKILSLDPEPPEILRKDSIQSWTASLDELIRSLRVHVNFIDGGIENDLFKICLN